MNSAEIKQQLYAHCRNYVDDKTGKLRTQIKDLKDSLESETRSSAGDKHETGRAMIQLEREKLGEMLREAERNSLVLQKVLLCKDTRIAGPGTVVRTNLNHYYLSVPAGKCVVNEWSVFCISVQSPIGILLLGKSEGDSIIFNNHRITVLEIF